MSKIGVEIILEVHDELTRNPKEIMWLLENTQYKCMKFNHVNRIYNL